MVTKKTVTSLLLSHQLHLGIRTRNSRNSWEKNHLLHEWKVEKKLKHFNYVEKQLISQHHHIFGGSLLWIFGRFFCVGTVWHIHTHAMYDAWICIWFFPFLFSPLQVLVKVVREANHMTLLGEAVAPSFHALKGKLGGSRSSKLYILCTHTTHQ